MVVGDLSRQPLQASAVRVDREDFAVDAADVERKPPAGRPGNAEEPLSSDEQSRSAPVAADDPQHVAVRKGKRAAAGRPCRRACVLRRKSHSPCAGAVHAHDVDSARAANVGDCVASG